MNQQIETQLRVQAELAKQQRVVSLQRRAAPTTRIGQRPNYGRSSSKTPAVPSLPSIPDQ